MRAVKENLSARQIEDTVGSKRKKQGKTNTGITSSNEKEILLLRAQEEKLRLCFGTGVRIRGNGKKGRIEIDFYDSEDLDRILEILDDHGE